MISLLLHNLDFGFLSPCSHCCYFEYSGNGPTFCDILDDFSIIHKHVQITINKLYELKVVKKLIIIEIIIIKTKITTATTIIIINTT